MVISINANPGQTITVYIQTVDGYGSRADGYQAPQVDYVLDSTQSQAVGYPQSMSKLETGVYYHAIVLPQGSSAIGTYLISVSWPHPSTSYLQYELFIINVGLPFGNTTVYPA